MEKDEKKSHKINNWNPDDVAARTRVLGELEPGLCVLEDERVERPFRGVAVLPGDPTAPGEERPTAVRSTDLCDRAHTALRAELENARLPATAAPAPETFSTASL